MLIGELFPSDEQLRLSEVTLCFVIVGKQAFRLLECILNPIFAQQLNKIRQMLCLTTGFCGLVEYLKTHLDFFVRFSAFSTPNNCETRDVCQTHQLLTHRCIIRKQVFYELNHEEYLPQHIASLARTVSLDMFPILLLQCF